MQTNGHHARVIDIYLQRNLNIENILLELKSGQYFSKYDSNQWMNLV